MFSSLEIEQYWNEFLAALPPGSPLPPEPQVWYFGDSQALALELTELVLEGKKTATAGLLWSYEAGREPLPVVGGLNLITDANGVPLCIIMTLAMEIVPFDQVSEEQAYLEGEGDRSLAYWREAHWRFFGRECAALGREPALDMLVVCERFRLVYPTPWG